MPKLSTSIQKSHRSPNYNDRPLDAVIDTVIIHYTDLFTFHESLKILTDCESQVSCHYLIDRDGSIYELVDPFKRAWHAGVSAWKGRKNINHYSIGIELQNGGKCFFDTFQEWEPYPKVQMDALVALLHDLGQQFPLRESLILGHDDIAPGRKIDPGPHFDWHYVRSHVKFN